MYRKFQLLMMGCALGLTGFAQGIDVKLNIITTGAGSALLLRIHTFNWSSFLK
jgi:hypothetical protein